MLTQNEEKLLTYGRAAFTQKTTQVADNVFHVLGLGHSNASFIIADHSVILIDSLETIERSQALKELICQYTDKPIKTLIFTHSHPDHTGGSAAFEDSLEEIISHSSSKAPLAGGQLLHDELQRRCIRQFGYTLTDEEAIHQGIGKREASVYGETAKRLSPTRVLKETKVTTTIDGVELELYHTPGEMDDTLTIWYPDKGALFSGDNYYACWPNLYALRGTPYRDISLWAESLDTLLSFPAQALLPGHTPALLGQENISNTLSAYRDAITYVLNESLKRIGQGEKPDAIAQSLQLPDHLKSLPFLTEFYGTIEWTVKGIYSGYLGWFDGNPTHLHPLSKEVYSKKMIKLIGGSDKILAEAQASLDVDPQWTAELADILLDDNQANPEIYLLKAEALERLARQEISANGRHYYLECAKELRSNNL